LGPRDECSPDDLPKARRACAERLRAELKAVAAPVVVPVGALGLHSALALTKKPQITQWRGSISLAPYSTAPSAEPASKSIGGQLLKAPAAGELGTPALSSPKGCDMASHGSAGGRGLVLPTIHPAFVMRAPKWGPILELDFARVGRVLEAPWIDPFESAEHSWTVAKTLEDLREAISSLEGDEIGFDVETVGLGPTRTSLVCFALSDGKFTVVVPWSRAQNGIESWWISPATAAGVVSRRLAKAVAVTHNGPVFDHIVAARYAIKIGKWEDTLLGAHSHASHLPKNLAHVATTYLDIPPWKQWDHAESIEKLWGYNARDTLYTILARQRQKKEHGL
jgi:hypothetical protein